MEAYLLHNIINIRYKFIKDEKKIKETLNFINLRNKFKIKLNKIKGVMHCPQIFIENFTKSLHMTSLFKILKFKVL